MRVDEISNQISTINKLKMVRFYQLFGEMGAMNGILAYYQDKTINLCEADTQFEALFDRIAKVYQREAAAGNIIADEKTKKILADANSFTDASCKELVSAFEEIEVPMVLPKAFSHIYLLPIVEYLLKKMYPGMTFDDRNLQWFGRGAIEAMLNGKKIRFPFQIQTVTESMHTILLQNVLAMGNIMKIEILFQNLEISVSYYDQICCYEGNLYCRVTAGELLVSHDLKEKGKQILHEELSCPEEKEILPGDRLIRMTSGEQSGWTAYRLPWGDLYFRSIVKEKEYDIIVSQGNDMTISFADCYQNLAVSGDKPFLFGDYSFRLYERGDITELHLLDMDYPRSGIYQENYAGNYYILKAGER